MSLSDPPIERDVVGDRDESAKWTRWAGIVFVATFVLGMMLGSDTPEYDVADDEWIEWYDDGGNRAMQLVSLFLLTIAAMSFVVFITGLVRQLRAANVARDMAGQVAYGAGLVLAAAIAVGGVAKNQMSGAIEIGDIPIPSADVLRTAEQLGFGIVLIVGGLFAALTVAAVSLAARGSTLVPKWLVTAGFVAAGLLLLSVAFIPIVLLPLWVLGVSITARPGARSH